MKRTIIYSVIGLFILSLGVFIGSKAISGSTTSNAQIRANLPQYKHINPLLFSDSPESADPWFRQLDRIVADYASNQTKSGSAKAISIYIRDMNTGRWVGDNENDTYTPSSMLKVLVMMAALKLAESDPSILPERLRYTVASSTLQYFKPKDNFTNGRYSVQELIGAMIKNSDNDALYALLSDERIDAEFNVLYGMFHLPADSSPIPVDYMSPKSYAEIFRTLYNSSMFQWDLSEQVLDLLTQTTFTQGIVAGVPSNIGVAHKFGEKADMDGTKNVTGLELHDCGIVYYPNRPYLLCIMTRGDDYSRLTSVISGVSRLVYTYFDASGKQN